GEHVADVEGADRFRLDARVGQCLLYGRRAEIAAAALRVLRDRRLPNAGNEHFSQQTLRDTVRRRASWQRVGANANRSALGPRRVPSIGYHADQREGSAALSANERI